ncbi:MAG: hypothetical protein ABSA39_10815 [Edaphobacter sp.]
MGTSVSTKHEYKTPAQMREGAATAAAVVSTPLVGTWKNINSATRDIVKVVIAAAGSGIQVDAYGACTPTPCNWGNVAGLSYASGVSSSPAVAFSAQYKFSFSQVILVGHLQGKELLLESFTHFTDGSGRSDYYATDTMTK